MSYTVHQAKTNLSKLIKEAESGQEVIIARGKQPVARLVAIASATAGKELHEIQKSAEAPGPPAPDAFDPLTDEELQELGLE